MDEVKINMEILLQVTRQELNEAREQVTLLKAMIAQMQRDKESEVNENSSDTVQTNELDK